MSSLFNNLSEELFQVLKGHGMTLTLYGENGNRVYEPKSATRMFAEPTKMMISIIESGSDSEVKLYLSQATDIKEISKLIGTLRQITTRFNVMFNVRKYGKELKPRDFAYQASVVESSMWGSTKTSYQKIGPAKLIVRHTVPVREDIIGSRGRNILAMFVETAEGERFKFPVIHLSAGRAFANHISQGGKPYDEIGNRIVDLAEESLGLTRLNKYIHHSRSLLGEDAVALRPAIKARIFELRQSFLSLARPKGYGKVKESLPSTSISLQESVGGLEEEISRLGALLHIDENHALAESLMPVALLIMGEQMTEFNENSEVEIDEAAYVDYDAQNDEIISRYEENFDPQAFLEDDYSEFLDATIDPADKADGIPSDYFIKGIAHEIASAFEDNDITSYDGSESFIVKAAKDLFVNDVKPILIQNGWNISEGMNEYEEPTEPTGPGGPEGPADSSSNVAVGDHVATDFGHGQVMDVSGDLATVRFLNGSTKQVYMNDLDKIDTLGNVAEELELAEWFDSFDPSNVLENSWENAVPPVKKAAPTNPNFSPELENGDRVTHKAYGSGTVVNNMGKFAKVEFDNPHARLPDTRTVTVSPNVLTKAGAYRKESIDELDEMFDGEIEVVDSGDILGGDLGQNLIDQTTDKVDNVVNQRGTDGDAEAELANLMKNAMYRLG